MTPPEPQRIKAFRLNLAKEIPKFPNDKATLQVLEAKSLGEVLIAYANWAIRYIAPRSRKVVAEPTASSDPRWLSFKADIQALLNKVVNGDDLLPHLSLQPHTRGFTPTLSAPPPDADRWADKDMLLNVMGYHHLHFDAAPTNQMRSDDMLFAHVTRDMFTVVGIFNHAVFEPTQPKEAMTAERNRLWEIFDNRSTRGLSPGTVYIPSMITTSGHSLHFVMLSMKYARIIAEMDPKLDDPTYVRSLYEKAGVPVPAKPKLKWNFHFLDLALLDERAGVSFILSKGPN